MSDSKKEWGLGDRWEEDSRAPQLMVPITTPGTNLADFVKAVESSDLGLPDDCDFEDLVHIAEAEGYFTEHATWDHKVRLILEAFGLDKDDEEVEK